MLFDKLTRVIDMQPCESHSVYRRLSNLICLLDKALSFYKVSLEVARNVEPRYLYRAVNTRFSPTLSRGFLLP